MKHILFFWLETLGINALFRRVHRGQVKTLLYHNVLPDTGEFAFAITPEQFEAHLIYLKQHYQVVRLSQAGELAGWRADRVNIVLTFDDGFINNYQFAFPLLRKHGLSACFFIIANCASTGAVPKFAARYMRAGVPSPAHATLTLEDIREMAAAGMTFGAHSLNHEDYAQLERAAGDADATASRAQLAASTGLPITLFAFPWGRSRPGQPEALRPDFTRIFTTQHGFNHSGDWLIRRNEVLDLPHLAAAASGALDFLRHPLTQRASPSHT